MNPFLQALTGKRTAKPRTGPQPVGKRPQVSWRGQGFYNQRPGGTPSGGGDIFMRALQRLNRERGVEAMLTRFRRQQGGF